MLLCRDKSLLYREALLYRGKSVSCREVLLCRDKSGLYRVKSVFPELSPLQFYHFTETLTAYLL